MNCPGKCKKSGFCFGRAYFLKKSGKHDGKCVGEKNCFYAKEKEALYAERAKQAQRQSWVVKAS